MTSGPEAKESDSGKRGGGLVRGTSVVAALTLVSRILGFVRDLLVARLFGAGSIADAYFVAFRIPNLLRSFVAEGALTSAFVPIFTHELAESREQAQTILRQVCGFLLIATIALSTLGIVFADLVVRTIAPGFETDPQVFELCVLLTRIMTPYIAFVSLVVLVNGALNAVHVFGASASAQAYMNLVLIAGALFAAGFEARSAAVILSVSVVVGGLVQVLTQLPALRRAGFDCWPTFKLFSPAIAQLLKLMVPAIFGASIYQLSIFVNTLLASLLQPGAVSWLFYADRVAQFPLGVFSLALASVLLPTLSRAQARKDGAGFSSHLLDSLRFTSFFIIPIAAAIFTLAEPITQLLFQRGAFSLDDTHRTAGALRMLAVGLWATSCHSMAARGFLAQKDTLTPTLIGLVSVAIGIFLSIVLMGPPATGHEGTPAYVLLTVQSIFPSPALGHRGLALASSIGSFVALSLSITLLRRRGVSLELGRFFASATRAVIASTAMGVALHFLLESMLSVALHPLLILAAATPMGALVYAIASLCMKSPEAKETLALGSRLALRVKGRST